MVGNEFHQSCAFPRKALGASVGNIAKLSGIVKFLVLKAVFPKTVDILSIFSPVDQAEKTSAQN